MAKVDITVRELVDLIKRRELRLPELQRRYVWPAPRVRDLLDSLYRGYPSGAILVWETSDSTIPTRDLQVGASADSAFQAYKLLLDGQQRLTSLSAVMRGEPIHVKDKKKPIEILFNLEHPEGPPAVVTEVEEEDVGEEVVEDEGEEAVLERLKQRTFVVAVRSLKNDPLWVSVTDIFQKSDSDILLKIKISPEDPRWNKYADRIKRVKKIADYPYVMHVLEPSLNYNEVAEIFVRVNSLGAKLRSSDLALAQITANWRGALAELEGFGEVMEKRGYEMDTGFLVRALVVAATNQSRFRNIGSLVADVDRLQAAWVKAKQAIEYGVNFASTNGKIENLELLSSPLLLIPIGSHFVARGESISSDEERAMLRWLVLGHIWRHFGRGSSETLLDADLALLKQGGDFGRLLDTVKQQVGRFDVQPGDLEGKDTRSAYFSTMYVVIKALGARDWFSGLEISLSHSGQSHKIQDHHIFPKALLKGKYEERVINDIANLAFIGGKTNRKISAADPKEYLPEVAAERGEEMLKAQLVPMDRALWQIDAYPQFLAERRKLIAQAINDFVAKI